MEQTLIINPSTNRTIKQSGALFRNLINDGWTFTTYLVPPLAQQKNYCLAPILGQWFLINSPSFEKISQKENYEVVVVNNHKEFREKVNITTVMGVNKIRIKINGNTFNKLINIGYTYDVERNRMIYPIMFSLYRVPSRGSYMETPGGLFEDIEPKHTHILVTTSLGTITITCNGRPLSEIREDYFKEVFYDLQINPEMEILSIKLYEGGGDVMFGPSYEGSSNCVIKCIEEHFKIKGYLYDFEKLYEEFNEGVFQTDIGVLSKRLKMKIIVNVSKDQIVYGEKRTNKAQLKLYYHNNHMTTVDSNLVEKETIFVKDLKQVVNTLKGNTITKIIKGKLTWYSIETQTTIYRLKEEEGIDLELEDCFSATSYYTRKFIKNNPKFLPIPKCHDNLDAIKSTVKNGITASFYQNYNNKELVCIDLKKAYSNYANFPEYTGFPTDLSQCISTTGIDYMSIVNTSEGFALTNMVDMFTDKNILRWISFPNLRHRLDLCYPYNQVKVSYLMFGINKSDLNCKMFDSLNKRALHKVFGKFTANNKNDSFVTSDPIVGYSYGGSHIIDKTDEEIFMCNNWIKSTSNSTYFPHISSYVHQYTEIQIEKMYLQLKKENIKVYCIWIDGITLAKKDIDKVTVNKDLWHIKEEDICAFTFTSENTYTIGVPPYKYSEKYNNLLSTSEKVSDNKFCINGEAGTGKSYNIRQLYLQLCNTIILVPTNALKRQYPGFNVETVDGYIISHKSSFTNIIIDEYTMVSTETLNKLDLSNKILILVGDNMQLEVHIGTPIDVSDFTIITLLENFRQMDPFLLEKLSHTRITGDLTWIEKAVTIEQAIKNEFYIICSRNETINDINIIGEQMNSEPYLLNSNNFTGVKINTPIKCNATIRPLFCAGDLGSIISVNIPEKTVLLHLNVENIDVEVPITYFTTKEPKIKKAYAITFHSVQGMTIDGNIAISNNKLWGTRMPYVGASRATRLSNLYLLKI